MSYIVTFLNWLLTYTPFYIDPNSEWSEGDVPGYQFRCFDPEYFNDIFKRLRLPMWIAENCEYHYVLDANGDLDMVRLGLTWQSIKFGDRYKPSPPRKPLVFPKAPSSSG